MTELSALYRIDQYIDTFALGHYARVLDARDQRTGQDIAFKVMRPEHLSPDGDLRWEYRAFANEANLLHRLATSPHVVDLLDCGYLSSIVEAPAGGEAVSFKDDVAGFIQAMPDYAEKGWRPYLTLENLPRNLNLLYLMRPDKPGTRFRLPSEEGISLALQFAEMLKMSHRQGIVYMDHKLEHVYWDGQRLQIIDLNSSRELNGDPNFQAHYFRMDMHNLCVGVLYPIFTGLSPQKTTLRPQPGTREEAEGRYSDVEDLDFGIEPSLSEGIKSLLQRGAALDIATVDEFIKDLRSIGARHGWDFGDYMASPASRNARTQLRAGLALLRQGQANIREAREIFREAAVIEDISGDSEAELRRLVKVINDMLNNRAIP